MSDEAHVFLSLIIPAYNEDIRIAASLHAAAAYLDSLSKPCELIVVNDGSTDGTLREIEEHCAGLDRLRLITYEHNRGKGYAVRQGIFASRGEYVAFSDADLSAPLEEFAKLFGAMEKGYDVAIGSRAVAGTAIGVHQPFYRELGGKGLNLIIQALAMPGIKDTQCGFKLFTGNVAHSIFDRCFIDGWGFDVEALYLARRMGCRIAEIGVKWNHAEGSKIRPFRAAARVIWDILRVRAHNYSEGER